MTALMNRIRELEAEKAVNSSQPAWMTKEMVEAMRKAATEQDTEERKKPEPLEAGFQADMYEIRECSHCTNDNVQKKARAV